MAQLIWSLRSRADLQDHYDHLLPRNQESAFRAVTAIAKAARKLADRPMAGMLVDKEIGTRKWPVAFGKYGFVIHYVPEPSVVTIVRIYHGRQSRPS